MKNQSAAVYLFIISAAFCSCAKSGSVITAPPVQDSTPRSVTVYLPLIHSKTVGHFVYNNQSQLTSVRTYSYDSSNGTPVTDSFLVSFTLAGTNNPPSAYDELTYLQANAPVANSAHHLLFYDELKRVTIDSISTASDNIFSTQQYTYDTYGNTVIQWLFGDPQTPGSYLVSQIDTMNVVDENIMVDMNYSSPGTFNRSYSRTYSTHANPLYNAALANSLGCLITFNHFFDFRSKYLPAQFTDDEYNGPYVTLNYLWKTDGSGAVVSGVGTDSDSGTAVQLISFTY